MARLTDKERWDSLYGSAQYPAKSHVLKKFTGKRWRKYFCPYYEHFLWNVVFEKYMPKNGGAKALEVGSAPGDFLVRLCNTFGFTPYGVEYSELGVIQNRKIFGLYGIDPNNVIYADFFDETFHQKYKGYFDIVISRGFIEHFTDVEDVINKHLNILAQGGCLIVSIPNLNRRSFYGAWSSLFDKDRLQIHNLDIMSKDAFTELFDRRSLSALFCDYYGTVHLGMLSAQKELHMRWIISVCCRLQRLLNPLLYFLFRDKGAESRLFSPMLLYIGLKRNDETAGDNGNV